MFSKGSFTNHVDKMRLVGGKSNVHDRPRKVGRWSLKCPNGQNIRKKRRKQIAKFASFIQKLAADIDYKFKLSFFIIKGVKLDLL